MFDEILQYYLNNIFTTLQAWKLYLLSIPWRELLSQGWCQILSPQAKIWMRSNEIIKCGAGRQIPRLSNLLPEGPTCNRDITTWVCFTKLTACGFKWLICTQVSLAIYRWPCVYVCVCVYEYAHACVYNYGSPSAEQETFLFGKAICWNRPAPFILSIITMQEKMKRKNDIQEKKKRREG